MDRLDVTIEACASAGHPGWLALRSALWPDCPRDEHLAEMQAQCSRPARYAQFLASGPDGAALGLVEVSLRSDHVNGTESSPVAFLEGLYVVPVLRQRGIARALVAAAAVWGAARGCREFGSDTALDNRASHAVHRALGFVETERVVFFRKALP